MAPQGTALGAGSRALARVSGSGEKSVAALSSQGVGGSQASGGGDGVLSWGTSLEGSYQMPLDLPPGGARIRAEARFGTWSSI